MLSGKQYWSDRINALENLKDDILKAEEEHEIPDHPDNFFDWIDQRIDEYKKEMAKE